MRKKKNKSTKNLQNSVFANGLAVFSICVLLSLILFGVFGKAGQVVSDFLIGIFGYAIYGYAVSGILIGIIAMTGRKKTVGNGIVLLYAVAVLIVIGMIHMYSASAFSDMSYGDYILQCYKSANTAGGLIAGIILYYPSKLYIFSQILAGLVLLGLIALIVVAQFNKEITFRAKKFEFKSKGEKYKKSKKQKTVYSQVQDDDYAVEDEREMANHDIDGNKLSNHISRRFTKKPINYTSLEDEINEDDYIQNQQSSYEQDNYRQYRNVQDVISDEVVDEALDVYRRRRSDAFDRLYSKNENQTVNNYQNDRQRSKDESLNILYGNKNKRNTPIKDKNEENNNDIYEGYSNRSRQENFNKNLNMLENDKNSDVLGTRDDNKSVNPINYNQENNLDNFSGYNSDNFYESTDSNSHYGETSDNDAITKNLFENIDKLFSESDLNKKTTDIENIDDIVKTDNDNVDESKNYPKSRINSDLNDYQSEKSEKNYKKDDYTFLSSQQIDKADNDYKKSEGISKKQLSDYVSEKSSNIIGKKEPAETKKENIQAEKQPQTTQNVKKKKNSLYIPPSIDCLRDYNEDVESGTNFEEKIQEVESCLSNFGIDAKVVNVVKGPTFSRLELEVPPGISVNKILQHYNDLAMSLAVESLRIEAPIPKKRFVGIEIPNEYRGTVGLKTIINSKEFNNGKQSGLFFALGKDIDGECYVSDISEYPHALVAGASGAGKSVCLNCMLISLLYKYSPEDLRLILIDPKEVEFNKFQGLPHLLVPEILSTTEKIINSLKWAIDEMDRRYSLLKEAFVSNIVGYNAKCKQYNQGEKLPYIVIVIDEAADIMQSKSSKEFEALIKRLTAKARAAGIHIILATQRPSVDVITGTIKANLPTRIAFAVVSSVDSKTILDYAGAEKLLRKGDMLYKLSTKPNPVRVQCAFIDDDEVISVVEQVKNNNESYFDEEIQKAIDYVPAEENSIISDETGESGVSKDALFLPVLKFAIENGSISISLIQRKFAVGFQRAGKLFDMMEKPGYISKVQVGTKPREVLLTMEEFLNLYPEAGED